MFNVFPLKLSERMLPIFIQNNFLQHLTLHIKMQHRIGIFNSNVRQSVKHSDTACSIYLHL